MCWGSLGPVGGKNAVHAQRSLVASDYLEFGWHSTSSRPVWLEFRSICVLGKHNFILLHSVSWSSPSVTFGISAERSQYGWAQYVWHLIQVSRCRCLWWWFAFDYYSAIPYYSDSTEHVDSNLKQTYTSISYVRTMFLKRTSKEIKKFKCNLLYKEWSFF